MPAVKAQLVKWGNSQAVRLPKSILEAAQLTEGDQLEITVENGQIVLEPETARPTLESLVSKITPQNRHREQDWGRPAGNEVW
jgi:antitoxin MazE